MKYLFLFSTIVLLSSQPGFSQQSTTPDSKAKVKASRGIKQYWFVLLVAGKDRSQDSAAAAKIQAGHMANMERLYNEGKLKVAGPFGDPGDWKGIFIFDPEAAGCKTKEELEKILATDPAIAAGRLGYEIHSWWTAPTGSFIPGIPAKLP